MQTALLALVILLADAPAAVDLNGKVVGPDGNPVVGAVVQVYSAAPNKGTSPIAETDYPDCQKSATADAAGAFSLAGVDASLDFQLLVLADGYRPLMLKKVNPARGAVTAKLKQLPADLDAAKTIRGRVVDSEGAPLAGARVTSFGCRDGNQRWWGGTSEQAEDETFSDTKGEFVLLCKKPDIQLDLRFFARNQAPQNNPLVPTGEAVHEVTMTPGATITGRIVKDGQPLEGVAIKLVQQDRGVEHYIGDFGATSDADGKFPLKHIPSNDKFNVYATMKSLGDRGSMSLQQVSSDADGSTTDAGDLVVGSGFTLKGELVCSDGKPLPKSVKVNLSRWNASDSVQATAEGDGKFEFKCVPSDLCQLWVDLNGYHVSSENESYEPANARFLLGLIDDNIDDLRVQLDPGPNEQSNYQSNKWNTLQNTRMKGIGPKE